MSALDPAQLDALVLEAQEGDKDAFAQIFNHFFEAMYRYVSFRVNPEEVDDIVENVFVKAWVHLPKYHKRDCGFGSWLYRIASNTVIDHRRTHRSISTIDPALPDPSLQASPLERTEKILESEQVREALDLVKEPYRQILTMKFLEGLSNLEIAETLGRSEGNIRVLQFRALKALKTQLEQRGFSEKL